MRLEHRIKAARGELRADLLIRNCRLVNVCSGEIHPADVAVSDGVFLGFGDYRAEQVIEAGGRYLCPGLIDGHLHIESSLLSPVEFAKAAAAHGTAAVICDPHEICNVLGVKGLEYMLAVTEALPLAVYCQVPSCVPATHLETAGGRIDAQAIAELLARYPHRLTGLAEMMNFPGVLLKDPGVLAKLRVAKNLIIDGHCPQLGGRDLNAYILAGPGSEAVYLRGQEIGEQTFEAPPAPEVHGSVKFASLAPADFQMTAPPGPPKARCLELIPGQILTGTRLVRPGVRDGLALPVIPELRLTDKGLVDVHRFDFVSLWTDEL